MSKHTPGPWTWEPHVFPENGGKWLNHNQSVHSILYYTTDDDGLHAENEADMALIAAAPDMLKVLQIVCGKFNKITGCRGHGECKECIIKNAIAKAKGEQS
jgi:hypothetical protein